MKGFRMNGLNRGPVQEMQPARTRGWTRAGSDSVEPRAGGRSSSGLAKGCLVFVLLCWFVESSNVWSGEGEFRPLNWTQHLISPDSEYSACAVFDVNRDGKKDVFCGGFWYEAPSWIRHVTRDVPSIGGRYDDYSNLPLDVNQDGRTDIVSVNYRSRSIFWVQQPADLSSSWITHRIDSPGPSETGRLVDIDRDGQLDLLPNGTSYAAWYTLTRTNDGAHPTWQRFELPIELAGHGIGWGDINSDGRVDLVGPRGWAEAPEMPRSQRWIWHPEFRMHSDVSIPILVEDVDQDGDQDLVWGRAHHTGVYWLQQHISGFHREWQMHVIDTEVAQSHALLWTDLDGNGRHELVTGKRWLAHDGRDVGEWDPPHVVRYEYHPERGSWNRQWISQGGKCGIDLDAAAVDLDQDGDLDLVAPSRVGLYWVENRGPLDEKTLSSDEQKTAVPADSLSYRNAKTLLVLKSPDGTEQTIREKGQWGERRHQILQRMQDVMGPLPTPEHRVPLKIQVESEERLERYLRVRLSYSATATERVPAYLLIPHERTAPGAAMLCLHQTQPLGKGEVCGLGGKPSMFYAHELAERGYVCLAPDYPSFGDYSCDFDEKIATGASGSMKAIWNNLRAVDLLESRADVDPNQIGCIGHSLGGHNGLFTAAFDQRLRAVVTSCGFTSFFDYYGGDLAGWTSKRYMPRISSTYHNDPRQMPFDFEEVLGAICPRSIFVNAPLHDDNFDVAGVKKVLQRVDELYGWFSANDGQVTAQYPDAQHDFPEPVRLQVYEWLDQQLGRDAAR